MATTAAGIPLSNEDIIMDPLYQELPAYLARAEGVSTSSQS